MAKEMGKVVLIGKRRSGSSTLANLLVNGLKDCPLVPIDTSSICETYVGRGWTVVDTMGFGEPLVGIVPEEYARKMAIDFLKEVRGRYSHIIFVVDIFDIYDEDPDEDDRFATLSIWNTFLEIFTGGEENFVALVTSVNPGMSIESVRARTEEMFPECKQFLYVICMCHLCVREVDLNNEEWIAKMRQQELGRLEKEMKEMFKGNSWAEPDIFKMGNEDIEEKAGRITQQITRSRVFLTRPSQRTSDEVRNSWQELKYPLRICKLATWGCVNRSLSRLRRRLRHRNMITETLPSNTETLPSNSEILQGESRNIFYIRRKLEFYLVGNNVKFYRRQCVYLLQRSLEASKECLDVCDATGMNWEQYCLAPLVSSLDRLGCSLRTGIKLLELCIFGNEQEVALTLSPPIPSGDSCSKFAIVLRDLDWSLDAFRFVFRNPEAGHAVPSKRQSWLLNFLWCEERCRPVYTGDCENRVADADHVKSCLVADNERQARDRQDLISSLDSLNFRSCCFPNRKSELRIHRSILKNRLQVDSTFCNPRCTVPGCFLIPENLKYKIVKAIGKGSFKVVLKCEWMGMEVAIATFLNNGETCNMDIEAAKMVIEAEAGLLARVQHPNVITFIGYRYDEEEQQGYLVTEVMKTNLRALINEHMSQRSGYPFTLLESIDLLLQIVEAMIHVHECGVIHRDLKALNCLVNEEAFINDEFYHYTVKLIDFGESKSKSSEMGSNFKTRNKGTRAWMAPEVYGREGDEIKEYTWSADVYSFGMTCYEILTGEVPFEQIRGRSLTEMVSAGHRPPIPNDCPNDLRELMKKCWDQNPEVRPSFKDIRPILWNCKLYYTIWES